MPHAVKRLKFGSLESIMADTKHAPHGYSPEMDGPAHESMYEDFVHFVSVSGVFVACCVVALGVGGVVDLYQGLLHDDRARIVHAYETWGFKRLSNELIDVLNIWARFIYGPLLEDRVRTIADGVKPSEYGRREAFRVHRALKEKGPVTVPREFVFMDRAAIGLGAVFLHLQAELNYHRLFEAEIARFSLDNLAKRQGKALAKAGLPEPD